ncbi:hypothetical protein [Roseobacter sinensis]|uniref:Uncharacterized protein n=1 Tax=Roseobacter sinensis TaxID=2931391 RepID=A0ABT3BEN3_9RHOB|nr:hypothetical protein [Roseobacter sp. WL0113]MCV3272012.1 hypothetical protein [Roseobacter sp. WL0113]
MADVSLQMSRASATEPPVHPRQDGRCGSRSDYRDILSDHIFDKLGPCPRNALIAMVDYGLNDEEIGGYYRMSPKTIAQLRGIFGIDAGN